MAIFWKGPHLGTNHSRIQRNNSSRQEIIPVGIFQKIKKKVFSDLKKLKHTYHNYQHTKAVIRRTKTLCSQLTTPFSSEDQQLLEVAALMHDYDHSGTLRRNQRQDLELHTLSNEEFAALKADELFREHLDKSQREKLKSLILATTFFQIQKQDVISTKSNNPYDAFHKEEKILIFADLGGFIDGFQFFFLDGINVISELQPHERPADYQHFLLFLASFLARVRLCLESLRLLLKPSHYENINHILRLIEIELLELQGNQHPASNRYQKIFTHSQKKSIKSFSDIKSRLVNFIDVSNIDISQYVRKKTSEILKSVQSSKELRMSRHWMMVNVLSCIFVLIHLSLFNGYFGKRFEPYIADVWFQLRGAISPPDEFAIVGIDLDSYKNLGISTTEMWPRNKQAALIHVLKEQGAKAVIFNAIFQGNSDDPHGDRDLAEALGSFPSIIGSDVSILGSGVNARVEDFSPELIFIERASGLGRVSMPIDSGIARRFSSPISFNGQTIIPLAQKASELFNTATKRELSHRDFINYYGPSGIIPVVSFYKALEPKQYLPPNYFKNKLVFVGYYITSGFQGGTKDSYISAYDGNQYFGVEVHATAAANLFHSDWIKRYPLQLEIIGLGIGIFLVCVVMFSLKPYWSALVMLLIAGSWAACSYNAFLNGRFIPGLIAILFILPLIFLASTLYYYLVIYRSQRRIHSAFAHYLMPEMVDRIADNAEVMQLGGQLIEVTMLFSDISGFTTLLEKADPGQVTSMLNKYFSEIAAIALEERGTLIKFIGDGMFVIWGAPVDISEPSDYALKSAIRIQERVAQLTHIEQFPELKTRIGLHRDTVVVGNFGSARRFDYTAVGDGVNVASRLEQLNKKFGTSIIFSESVRNDLHNEFSFVPLGRVQVYGREYGVDIFTIFDQNPSTEVLALWSAAITHFSTREWKEAEAIFTQVKLREQRLKLASQLYLEFIESYKILSPEDEWCGELRIDSK